MAFQTYSMTDIKNKLMRPATTSHFQCTFQPPTAVTDFMKSRYSAGVGPNYDDREIKELIDISCTDASLPGSSFQTGTLVDSYTGVNEAYAYRRAYDNRADFTFTVDNGVNESSRGNNYNVLLFFENWMSYIADERLTPGAERSAPSAPGIDNINYFYRLNYPDDYMTQSLRIYKFEKDSPQLSRGLEYNFVSAFPLSMTSMPVSYQSSQLLKCTVSFSYQRYVIKRV